MPRPNGNRAYTYDEQQAEYERRQQEERDRQIRQEIERYRQQAQASAGSTAPNSSTEDRSWWQKAWDTVNESYLENEKNKSAIYQPDQSYQASKVNAAWDNAMYTLRAIPHAFWDFAARQTAAEEAAAQKSGYTKEGYRLPETLGEEDIKALEDLSHDPNAGQWEFSDRMETLHDRAGEWEQKAQETLDAGGVTKVGKFAGDATASVVQQLPHLLIDVAAAGVGLPGAGLAVMGAGAYATSYYDGVDKGLSAEDASMRAFLIAGTEVLTEKMWDVTGIRGGGALDEMLINKVFAKNLTDPVRGAIMKTLVSMGTEGVEELISSLADNAIDWAYLDQYAGMTGKEIAADFIVDAANDFLMGAAVALLMDGTISNTLGYAQTGQGPISRYEGEMWEFWDGASEQEKNAWIELAAKKNGQTTEEAKAAIDAAHAEYDSRTRATEAAQQQIANSPNIAGVEIRTNAEIQQEEVAQEKAAAAEVQDQIDAEMAPGLELLQQQMMDENDPAMQALRANVTDENALANQRNITREERSAYQQAYQHTAQDGQTRAVKIGNDNYVIVRDQGSPKIFHQYIGAWTKGQADAMNIAKRFGTRFTLVDSLGEDNNALYTGDGRVLISSKSKAPAMGLLIHELTHSLERTKAYKALRDFVLGDDLNTSQIRKAYNNRAAEARAELERLRAQGSEDLNEIKRLQKIASQDFNAVLEWAATRYSDAEFESELVARYCEEFLGNEDAINDIINRNMNLATKIWEALKDIVAKLGGIRNDAANELRRAEKLWADAIAERKNLEKKAREGSRLKSGFVRKSIKSIMHDLEGGLDSNMLTDLRNSGVFSEDEAMEFFTNVNKLVDRIMPKRSFLDMNEDTEKGNRPYHPFKQNSDKLYEISLDFSTLCKKRIITQAIIERLNVAAGEAMSSNRQFAIAQLLREYQKQHSELQVACALCYVEAARLKSPKTINAILKNPAAALSNYYAQQKGDAKNSVKEASENLMKVLGLPANASKTAFKEAASGFTIGEFNNLMDRIGAEGAKIQGDSSKMVTQNQAFNAYNEYTRGLRESAVDLLTDEQKRVIEIAKHLDPKYLLTADGLTQLKMGMIDGKYVPGAEDIYKAFTKRVTSATRSKALEQDVAYYYGDADSVSDGLIRKMNKENGLRTQSWSDFQMFHLLDTITSIAELSVRGAKMHGYTKVPEFVYAVGNTGLMINLSLIPDGTTGMDSYGNLAYSGTEGMAKDIADHLRDLYPETAGTICIGINDNQIRALLNDDTVDYVIPYHVSGLTKHLREIANIHKWENYTGTQNEKVIPGRAKGEEIKFSDWFTDDIKNQDKSGLEIMRDAQDNYLRLCYERGYIPKFPQFLHNNGDGSYSISEDAPNYWKLLIDRKMINNATGEIIEQKAVKPNFQWEDQLDENGNVVKPGLFGLVDRADDPRTQEVVEKAAQFVEDRIADGTVDAIAANDPTVRNLQEIFESNHWDEEYDDYVNDLALDPGDDIESWNGDPYEDAEDTTKLSAGEYQVLDREYNAAVKDSDMETAQHLVDEAAKNAGYTIKAYHGTSNGNFTVFDRGRAGENYDGWGRLGKGFYFASSERAAKYFGERSKGNGRTRVIPAYLDMRNSIDVFAPTPQNLMDYIHTKYAVPEGWGEGGAEDFLSKATYRVIDFLQDERHEDVRDVLEGLGYDGVYSGDGVEYVVFNPNQIKSADPVTYDDQGNVIPLSQRFNAENNDIRYSAGEYQTEDSREYAPTFYSHMARVIDGIKDKKMQASAVEGYLRGKGVKEEELKWSGIRAFLQGKTHVTKEALAEFAKGSMLQVSTKERTSKENTEFTNDVHGTFKNEDELKKYFNSLGYDITDSEVDPFTGNYMVMIRPYGETYDDIYKELNKDDRLKDIRQAVRAHGTQLAFMVDGDSSVNELVRRLKSWGIPVDTEAQYALQEYMMRVAEANEADMGVDTIEFEIGNQDNVALWDNFVLKGGKNYREYEFILPQSTYRNEAMGRHWGKDKGVLAHARVYDYETQDGGRMLFVDEIQSDWHNQGSEGGYYTNDGISPEEYSKQIRQVENDIEELLKKPEGQQMLNAYSSYFDMDEGRATGQLVSINLHNLNRNGKAIFGNEIAQSNTYKAYHDLVKTRNDLIDKSDEVYDERKGKAEDAPFKNNAYTDFVLKNMLRMAAEQGYDKIGWTTAEHHDTRWKNNVYADEANGKGKSGFLKAYQIEYDHDIPKFLSKFGKQWGAKVGHEVLPANGETVWSMPITDEMKESVLYKGQPMYSAGEYQTEDAESEVNEMMDDPSDAKEVSDFLNEDGRLDLSKGDTDELIEFAQDLTGNYMRGQLYGYRDLARFLDDISGKDKDLREMLRRVIEIPLENQKRPMVANIKQQLADLHKVQEETGIHAGTRESAAAQWLGEGYRQLEDGSHEDYTLDDLKREFPDKWQDIQKLERYCRQVYDEYVDKINAALESVYPNVEKDMLDKMDLAKAALEKAEENLETAQRTDNQRLIDSCMQKRDDAEKTFENLQKDYISGDYLDNKRLRPKKDYFHHFKDISSKGIGNLKNVLRANESSGLIDPDLVGKSEFTKPKSKWTGFLQRQGNGQFDADAMGGLAKYINEAEYIIAIDPYIAHIRNVVSDLAKATKMTRNANSAIMYLTRFANSLAGKQASTLDRAVVNWNNEAGRKVLNGIIKFNNRVKANSVMGNITSSIKQISNIPNAMTMIKDPVSWGKGIADYLSAMKSGEMSDLIDSSVFMTERYMDTSIDQFKKHTVFDKPKQFAAWMLGFGDEQAARMIWFSAYEDALRKGEENPVRYADDITRRSVAGRGVGEIPYEMQGKMENLLMPYQIEVNNSWQNLVHIVGDKDAGALMRLMIGSHLVNMVTQAISGANALPDVLGIIIDAIKKIAKRDDDEEEESVKDILGEALKSAGGEVMGSITGVGVWAPVLLGMDKDTGENLFGESSPTTYGQGIQGPAMITEALMNLSKYGENADMVSPALKTLMPWGGTQLARTYNAMQDLGWIPEGAYGLPFGEKRDIPGSYSPSGNLRFKIDGLDDTARALLFGSYATSGGKDYLENRKAYATADQLAKIVPLAKNAGVDPATFLDVWKNANLDGKGGITQREGATAIGDMDISDDQKLALWRGMNKEDAAVLKIVNAAQGEGLDGWEYLTAYFGADTTGKDGVPDGTVSAAELKDALNQKTDLTDEQRTLLYQSMGFKSNPWA